MATIRNRMIPELRYVKLSKAARELGVARTSLARICRGKRHKGVVPGACKLKGEWWIPRPFIEMYSELLKWERKKTGWVMMECVY